MGAVNGIASVVGPNLGSLILNLTGRWNWLFLINLPIALFVIISGYLVIPETRTGDIKTIDFKGLVLLSLGILSFMLAITNLQSRSLVNSFLRIQVWGLIGLGIILFMMFIQIEKRVPHQVDPFLPYQLLRSRGFVLTLLMGLLSGALIGIFVFIPSFVEQRYGISADNSGVWMSGIGLGSIVGAAVGGSLTSKLGSTKTIVVSGLLATFGFALIAYLSPNLFWFAVSSTIAGIGFGMLMGAPLSVLMAEVASKKDNGVALGTLSVSRQVGITIAPIVYATVIQNGFSSIQMNTSIEQYYRGLQRMTGSGRHQLLQSFYATAQEAYQHMFWLAILASVVVTLCGWYLMIRKHRLANELNHPAGD
ncbi:drug resistance transporter, EmrB/QacA family [Lentilactobacillus farraginis DSM 18382 = JCM 14108]|uniref:Drug resistance transporter, EmrB/QacA family n=1 Tax=Lentilactobacillus farraginis DSM 18382 = JCM 14108 TaxID=1423743 RepID=X0PAY2_9LACO|nr:MFS transporter [Lentilactobacillus farraginis]GAF36934.1 drug resistance transporter, EmrB/QacA family [Lentilactobacillus farraginis DSM 18382 = JCM 14108]